MLDMATSPSGSLIVKFGLLTLIWVSQDDYSLQRHRNEEEAARIYRYLRGDTR